MIRLAVKVPLAFDRPIVLSRRIQAIWSFASASLDKFCMLGFTALCRPISQPRTSGSILSIEHSQYRARQIPWRRQAPRLLSSRKLKHTFQRESGIRRSRKRGPEAIQVDEGITWHFSRLNDNATRCSNALLFRASGRTSVNSSTHSSPSVWQAPLKRSLKRASQTGTPLKAGLIPSRSSSMVSVGPLRFPKLHF